MCKFMKINYINEGCKKDPKHIHEIRQISQFCRHDKRGLGCPNLEPDIQISLSSAVRPGQCSVCSIS